MQNGNLHCILINPKKEKKIFIFSESKRRVNIIQQLISIPNIKELFQLKYIQIVSDFESFSIKMVIFTK